MTREAVTHLYTMLNNDLQSMGFGGHPMPGALKVTVALNFYASGSFQGSTGDFCRVSQSVVHCCIKKVTDALYCRTSDCVHFRIDLESQAKRATEFGAIEEFPQAQGVIDCMNVAIKESMEQPATFINRKGFHSINVQLVWDHRKCFLQVCARFPGSCHDSYILCQSRVLLLFTAPAHLQAWILGDKGYPLMTWLLMLKNPSNDAKECYNSCHGSIEQAIGMLKMCFHCLDRSGGTLQYAPDKVGCIVVVCCILHITVQSG
ncbi:putative nuclease HARBI1 [Heterodontus francisci]|uniref:putative nuclease HARBI1 n=1 Tax=Heterodontus francisci TaxID=7792 RepID=UPI00355AFDB1